MATMALLVVAGPAVAQGMPGPRDFVRQKIDEGRMYDASGDSSSAAASYYSAIVDVEDPDGEAADLRAIAELALCLDDVTLGRKDQGRQVCQMVLDNPQATSDAKNSARASLAKFD